VEYLSHLIKKIRRWTDPISLPCRCRPAILPPIAPLSPIAATAVHRDLYATHRDRAAVSPSIAPPPPLPSPTAIVPPPLPSPIATPAVAHRDAATAIHRLRRAVNLTPPPIHRCPISPLVRVLAGDGGGDKALQLTSDGAPGDKRLGDGGQ